ncbi:MAG: 3-phosphoshikimate 1-carboxyvinyltransferase [Ruminococcus sp.]|jgi:3-phosphoshikimate 1-carboxyvinyltransferase|nr:3-phosphoshikimate 1-carboxyvinyltransferase [Ruminococcus sp.]
MEVKITPKKLSGKITAPPSKSFAHRALIAAALCKRQTTEIRNVALSDDISATINCLEAIGAKIKIIGKTAFVTGITEIPKEAVLDCRESGSTLRFLIPVCAALGIKTTFKGAGKLPSRPVSTYVRELSKKGINFSDTHLPFTISGQLKSGRFDIEGNISSQYISGLMFALPLIKGESKIHITGKFESVDYVDMTEDVLAVFGVFFHIYDNTYTVRRTSFECLDEYYEIEGDWSNAAFFKTAEALGNDVKVSGLDEYSIQGDGDIADFLTDLSECEKLSENEDTEELITSDFSDMPDIVPICAVAVSAVDTNLEKFTFKNVSRLTLKESNRLKSTADMINALGGKADFDENSLTVYHTGLTGGKVDGCNDHRIVMSAAIAATVCESEVIITDAEAVKKSYPDFWDVYKKLGGNIEVRD